MVKTKEKSMARKKTIDPVDTGDPGVDFPLDEEVDQDTTPLPEPDEEDNS